MTPAPPTFLVWVAVGVVLAGTVMAVVGALRTGVSWDEPFHVMRLRNYLEHGWFSVDWSTETAASTSGDNNTLVYGPVAMLLLHGLCTLLGIEEWHTVATSPAAYDARHLGVVVIGLVGTAAAAALTRILLGSWRWAAITAAVLLALPMWTGHLMFNVKDVPVATGYTLLTLALVAMVAPRDAPRAGHRWVRIACLAAGITLMVGTRPAMVSAVLVAGVLLALGARTALQEAAAGLAVAAALLVAVYPHVFAHPLLLVHSVQQSASFRDDAGAGYHYVPFYFLAQVPLLLQGLFAVGVWWAVRVARREWSSARAGRLTLVMAQSFALPLVAIAKDSDLYNGLRQLLFASPTWAVVATLGLAHLSRRAQPGHPRHLGPRLLGGLSVCALVLPVVDQATLFPYQYSYYNAAADVVPSSLDTDYWRTSVPELLPTIPTDGQVVCGPTRSTRLGAPAGSEGAHGVGETAMRAGRFSSDSSVDCRTDPLGPLAPAWAADGLPYDDALPHDEFYVVIDRGHALPRNCTQLASVDRHRHWRTVSMTYVARCRLEPRPLEGPGGVVSFSHPDGENMAPPLWAYAPEGWVMRESPNAIDAAAPEASLTFALPVACAARPCSLVLDADTSTALESSVNDEPTEVTVAPGQVTVALRQGLGDAWVTFTTSTGTPLGLRIRTMHVVPTGTG